MGSKQLSTLEEYGFLPRSGTRWRFYDNEEEGCYLELLQKESSLRLVTPLGRTKVKWKGNSLVSLRYTVTQLVEESSHILGSRRLSFIDQMLLQKVWLLKQRGWKEQGLCLSKGKWTIQMHEDCASLYYDERYSSRYKQIEYEGFLNDLMLKQQGILRTTLSTLESHREEIEVEINKIQIELNSYE